MSSLGVDIAFISNGYVYHTRYDDAKSIPSGSIQRAGENIFGVMKGIICSPYLEDPGAYKHGATVFFDVFGMFVVHYPQRLHSLMNVMTCVVVLLFVTRHIVNENRPKGKRIYLCQFMDLSIQLSPQNRPSIFFFQVKGLS